MACEIRGTLQQKPAKLWCYNCAGATRKSALGAFPVSSRTPSTRITSQLFGKRVCEALR